jgi:hypothetical protein
LSRSCLRLRHCVFASELAKLAVCACWTLPTLTLQPAFRAATSSYLQKEGEDTSNAAQAQRTPNSLGWPILVDVSARVILNWAAHCSPLTHWNNSRSIADLHTTPSRIGPRHNETLPASQRMPKKRQSKNRPFSRYHQLQSSSWLA